MKIPILLALTLLSHAAGLRATTVNVALTTTGTPSTTGGALWQNFASTGASLAGATVAVTIDFNFPNTTETSTWAATGATSGSAVNVDTLSQWSLSLAGDSGVTNWVLVNNATFNIAALAIRTVVIDLSATSSVFDVLTTTDRTPGSGAGLSLGANFGNGIATTVGSLAAQSGNAATTENHAITATYSNRYSVTGSPACLGGPNANTPCLDTYKVLTLQFGGTTLGQGDSISWLADTDLLTPEPSTFTMLAGALISLYVWLRRRNALNRFPASR